MDKLQLVVATLCVLLTGTFGDQEPVLNPIPRTGTLRALERSTHYLECTLVAGIPSPTITWRKKGMSDIELATGPELLFESVQQEDSGTYTCTATNSVGSKTLEFKVSVYALQEGYGFAGSRTVIKNTQSKMKIMKWYKKLFMQGDAEDPSARVASAFRSSASSIDGFEYDKDTGDLIVQNTALSHESIYTLTAGDFIKVNWSFNKLYVYVKPSAVRMVEFPPHVTESVQVSVLCFVDRVKPANVTFTWMLASAAQDDATHAETVSSNSDGTFSVTSTLTKSFFRRDDQQSLRCDVKHGVDKTLNSHTENNIIVYYKYQSKARAADASQRPVEGKSTTLLCEVVDRGKPAASLYKWYRNNVELHDSSDGKISGVGTEHLTLRGLTVGDNGEYGCRIQNGAGFGIQAKNYTLEVLYMPRVNISGPSTVDEDEHVPLRCSVDAKPRANPSDIKWFLNGVLLPQPVDQSSVQSVYILRHAKRTDHGKYNCTVTNDIGTTSKAHLLDVRYRPTGRPKVTYETLVMKVETTQMLTCDPSTLTNPGNPPHSEFAWMRDGQVLEAKDATLDINPQLVTESGGYTCAVRNIMGLSNYSTRIPVSVQAPVYIETNTTHTQYEPRFDNRAFFISYNVSGGQNLTTTLSNSSKKVLPTDFKMETEDISGTFQYGQQTAKRITYTWQIDGKLLKNCGQVGYFNGEYSFQAKGMVASVPSSKSAVFRIAVQYPAMWKGAGQSASSAMGVNKTLECDVCANPPPTKYQWRHGAGALPQGTLENGAFLHITNVDSRHFGSYDCTVSNTVGHENKKRTFPIKLEERGSPHKPVSFSIASKTSETLLISWTVAFNGGYDLVSFDIEYHKSEANRGDGTEVRWDKHADKMMGCLTLRDVCTARIRNLQPNTMYSLRIRAKNKRPAVMATDPYSDYVTVEGRTKALPQIFFDETKITKTTLTVKWSFKEQEERDDMSSLIRRRRSVSSDDEISLEILYKGALELDYMRYPKSELERVQASALRAVVHGKFDVTQAYDVIVHIYEGTHKISTPEDVSTHLAGVLTGGPQPMTAQTGIIAGAVVGALFVVAVITIASIIIYRHKGHIGSDVELRRNAGRDNVRVIGYHPVTNTASTESIPCHPKKPKLPDPTVHTDVVQPPMARPVQQPRLTPRVLQSNGQKENPYMNVPPGGVDPQSNNLGSLYENVPKLPRYENVSFPAERHPPAPPDGQGEVLYDEVSRPPHGNVHPQGEPVQNTMIYTDVAFDPAPQAEQVPPSSQVRIHGTENRVDYAQMDFEKMGNLKTSDSYL